MIRGSKLPAGIESKLPQLGSALASCRCVVFAYLFGGAARGPLRPLSDVDVAVFVDENADPVAARLEVTRAVTRHLGTDEVDIVLLNTAPVALLGRILQSRRVVLDREPFRRHGFESLAMRQFADFRLFEHRLLARRFQRA
jgi:hypothetical protein